MLLASLDTLTKGESELCDKINQLIASQSMVKAILLQMCMNSLKVTKCTPEETLFSSSHWAQVAEDQTEALVIKLAELQ